MNNLGAIADIFYPHIQHESSFRSKLSEIVEACECSKDIMIAIYGIEKNQFLYCNTAFKKLIGKDYVQFVKKGWDIWIDSIDNKESSWFAESISNFFKRPFIYRPLALRYHISHCSGQKKCIQHEIRIYDFQKCPLAINYFSDISDKERLEHCLGNKSEPIGTHPKKEISYSISGREKEVLHLIGEGYSSKQIADKLYISNHTAISHRKNLIEKFNVKNTAHLVKRASELLQL